MAHPNICIPAAHHTHLVRVCTAHAQAKTRAAAARTDHIVLLVAGVHVYGGRACA